MGGSSWVLVEGKNIMQSFTEKQKMQRTIVTSTPALGVWMCQVIYIHASCFLIMSWAFIVQVCTLKKSYLNKWIQIHNCMRFMWEGIKRLTGLPYKTTWPNKSRTTFQWIEESNASQHISKICFSGLWKVSAHAVEVSFAFQAYVVNAKEPLFKDR